MWTRRFFLAFFACLASSSAFFGACREWVPTARPVQPERVLEGATRVEMLLDTSGRYVLVSRFGDDDERTLSIVDWKNHRACAMPANLERFEGPLFGPKQLRGESPLFWIPVILRNDEGVEELHFADEHCTLQDSHGKFSGSAGRPTMFDDSREVLLFGDGAGNLSLADPWFEETTLLARKVRAVASVQQIADNPQALWLLEDGKLTQRTLDGTLVVSLGERQVTAFSQTIHNGLRVAYVDGGDLYEAIGPEFESVLLTDNACRPEYRSGFLDFFQPCADQQLVRILLFNGTLKEFEPGVYKSLDDSGYTIEYTKDDADAVHLFVEPPGRARVEIVPPMLDNPMVMDSNHLAGLIEVKEGMNTSRSFVVWSADEAGEPLRELFDHVNEMSAFLDIRSSSFLWLMNHDVIEYQDAGDGEVIETVSRRLSTFSERTPSLRSIAVDVPLRNPGVSGAVHGYSIEILAGYPEPLLLYITKAVPLEREPQAFRGELRARLLSGELGATIQQDVTSYAVVATPLPGVIYGVEEGERPGLWFAAL